MEPTAVTITQLREKLGEVIPEGGDASDTMFTDQQLTQMLLSARTFDHAVFDGWETKLAHWAGLVDTTDGAAGRRLGMLMEHAQYMINYYSKKIGSGPGNGTNRSRTRVGKIIRHG